MEVGVVEHMVLQKLRAHEAQGERRAVQGNGVVHAGQLRQQIWQRANVVFVAVCQQDTAQPAGPLAQVRHVRDYQIDPALLLLGELDPCIHEHDITAVFDHRRVLADLTHSPQGDYPHRPTARPRSRCCAVHLIHVVVRCHRRSSSVQYFSMSIVSVRLTSVPHLCYINQVSMHVLITH
jgi:hypothetical protein